MSQKSVGKISKILAQSAVLIGMALFALSSRADCTLPSGETLRQGYSDIVTRVYAYDAYGGNTCMVETLRCVDGQLDTYGGTFWVYPGTQMTTFSSQFVPYGSSCQSEVHVCNNGTLSGNPIGRYTYCEVESPPTCTLPWGGTINNGQSVTAYASSSVPYGSSCQSQTRTCSNGSLSGSYQYQSCSVQPPANCPTQTISWGPSNICTASVSGAAHGATPTVNTTSTGTSGSASLSCNNGTWTITSQTCTANLSVPASLSATDGTLAGKISVTWGSVPGASGYDLQYRKQGTSTWTAVNNVSSGWELTTTDESTFEFQVRAKNAAGNGNWSASETGYIRKYIDPVFVSQTVPSDVKVGSTFPVSQVWRNDGATTWNTSDNLGIAPASGSFTGSLANVGATTLTGQNGSFNASVTAPATPGSYSLVMDWRYNGATYKSSPAANIRVWGTPACSGIQVSKTLTYNPADKITVTATLGSEASSVTGARAWSLVDGQDDLQTYPVSASGPYSFEIDLSKHTGYGTYRAELLVSNPVETGVCSVDFELRQVSPVSANLSPVFGGDGANTFVLPLSLGPAINVQAVRTDNLPLNLALKDSAGTTIHANTMSGASAALNAAAWDAEQAWETRAAAVEVRYADDGAHAQVGGVTIPVTLMTPPTRLSVAAVSSEQLPFTVAATIQQNGQTAPEANVGPWRIRLSDNQGDAEIRSWQDAVQSLVTFNDLDYPSLWNKTLRVTARAQQPSGITLAQPFELTTTVRPAVMPARDIQATDGTLEEVVRITWSAPFDGMPGVTYTLLRNGQAIAPSLSGTMYEDVPPVRGEVYQYSVIAKADGRQSQAVVDPGYLPACILPRVETVDVVGSAQDSLGAIVRWLSCLENGRLHYSFDNEPEKEASVTIGNEWAATELPIGTLSNGEHTVVFRSFANNNGLNPPRTQTFTFTINRSGVEPGGVTLLYNGRPAANGQETDSIGRFGVKLEGRGAEWANFE
jgi:hypothetical protein